MFFFINVLSLLQLHFQQNTTVYEYFLWMMYLVSRILHFKRQSNEFLHMWFASFLGVFLFIFYSGFTPKAYESFLQSSRYKSLRLSQDKTYTTNIADFPWGNNNFHYHCL